MEYVLQKHPIVQYCQKCGAMQECALYYARRNGQLVGDRSVCPAGHVTWDWEWDRDTADLPRWKPPASRPKQGSLFG